MNDIYELYARLMERAHNFTRCPGLSNTCRISGPLVNEEFRLAGGTYEDSEKAARQHVRSEAVKIERAA
jgi:hypothetical protein